MGNTGKRRWGIIDIGSNTVRLCVYEIGGQKRFKELTSAKIPAALASYIGDDGVMNSDGIRTASKAVRKLARMAELMGCEKVFPFATAALRNCANSVEAIGQVEKRTGRSIRVLSGAEEAHMSLQGAVQTVDLKTGLFFDIGGGSTELMELRNGAYAGGRSIPMGSLSAWSREVGDIIPSPAELAALSQDADELVEEAGINPMRHGKACGIGGTMRLALKVARRINGERAERALSRADLDAIFASFSADPDRFARTLLQMNPARIHTFLPGCVIAREIMRRTGSQQALVAKTGVREGYLLQLLDEESAAV